MTVRWIWCGGRVGADEPRLPRVPGPVGGRSVDAADVDADRGSGHVGGGASYSWTRHGSRERDALLLPPGGRGHLVGVDAPRSGIGDAGRGLGATASGRRRGRAWRRLRRWRGWGHLSDETTCPSWVLASLGTSSSGVVECTKHGDPDAVSLEVLSRDARGATLELRTGGFWALREPSGTVRVFAGLRHAEDPSAPALPLRRALVEAVVGKKARLSSRRRRSTCGAVQASPLGGAPEMSLAGRGRCGRGALVSAPRLSRGYLLEYVARLGGTVFQGVDEECGRGDDAGAVRRVPADSGPGEPGAGAPVVHGTGVAETGTGSTGRVAPRKATPFR